MDKSYLVTHLLTLLCSNKIYDICIEREKVKKKATLLYIPILKILLGASGSSNLEEVNPLIKTRKHVNGYKLTQKHFI